MQRAHLTEPVGDQLLVRQRAVGHQKQTTSRVQVGVGIGDKLSRHQEIGRLPLMKGRICNDHVEPLVANRTADVTGPHFNIGETGLGNPTGRTAYGFSVGVHHQHASGS